MDLTGFLNHELFLRFGTYNDPPHILSDGVAAMDPPNPPARAGYNHYPILQIHLVVDLGRIELPPPQCH